MTRLWKEGRLSLEIGLFHVLDGAKCLGTKILTGSLLSRVCCSLTFCGGRFFSCPYSLPEDVPIRFAFQLAHLDFKI